MSLPAADIARGAIMLPRIVWRVSGDAALSFLHETTTQDLIVLGAGATAVTCVLDDKARMEAVVRVLVLAPDDVLLIGEEASRPGIDRLARFAPLSNVAIDATDLTVTAIVGEASAFDPGDDAIRVDGELVVVRTAEGVDILAPRAPEIDAPTISLDAFEAVRIAAGRARFGVDIAPGTLINETPLVGPAVSFTKGCYPGQESVAKIANLGTTRRGLAHVTVDGVVGDLPASLSADGTEVGALTSTARGLGIATLKSGVEPGTVLTTGTARVTVDRLL